MMKTTLLRKILYFFIIFLPVGAALAEGTLNVYNWSDYVAKDTVPGFKKRTGHQIKYDVYDSNDTLQAKLLTGNSGYDVVTPGASYMGRQITAGIYQKLDKTKLPNLKYLDHVLMAKLAIADPGNQYGVPWVWGSTGLGYNVTKVQAIMGKNAPLNSWDMFFKPENLSKLKRCGVSVLDQATEVFAAALFYLGKDPNSHNPADIQAAFNLLKKVRPYITQFSASSYINDLANGDVCMAVGWSGDVNIARRRAVEAKKPYEVKYFIPTGGAPMWFDVMTIPKDAKHVDMAHQWINYIEDPKVNAQITNEVFYPTANKEAHKYLKPEIANDPTIYPPEEVVKTLFLLKPVPPEVLRLQNRLWTQLKTGH